MNLPIPRISPFVRIRERVQSLPPFRLFNRNCDKCGVEIKSSYSPDRPETIYCESCYNKEVY